ncbi:MAG: LemA family protein [Synechococcaceae cyanobacterium SM2_3_1]|nr:LemA family protein [Synechococcaceae cyanobacterium SM2_3_1]
MGAILVLAMIAIGVAATWVVGLYNGLRKTVNSCSESWADLQTELKRRYDLIPRLVEIVKGYAGYEQGILDRVLQARELAQNNTGSPTEQSIDENLLSRSLGQLLVLVQKFPDLKANRNFSQLQSELVNTEDRIQRARRFYNANVRELNNRVDLFPSSLFASAMGIGKREYFEIDEAEVGDAPPIDFNT